MALGYIQLKRETNGPLNESTWAAGTYGTKILYPPASNIAPDIAPTQINRDDEIRNANEPSPILPDKFDPKMPLAVKGYPDTTAFLITLMYGLPTTVVGNGTITDLGGGTVPTGAYTHTWTAPFSGTVNIPTTAQVLAAYADQGVYLQGFGMGIQQLDLGTDDTVMNLSAQFDGLFMQQISNPSLTPAYEASTVQPWKPRNATLTTWLANTGLTVQGGLTYSFMNPFEKDRTQGVVSMSPNALFKTDLPTTTGTINKLLFDVDDWNALVASTGFAALTAWINDSFVTGSYPYKLFVKNTNLQYTGGTPAPLTNSRRLGASYNFKATDASGSGASTIIQVCNSTAAYV